MCFLLQNSLTVEGLRLTCSQTAAGKPEMVKLQTFLFNRRDLRLFHPDGHRSGCWLVAWWSFTLCRSRSHPNNPLFRGHCKRVYYYAYYKSFLPKPLSWAPSSASRTHFCGRGHRDCTKDTRPCGQTEFRPGKGHSSSCSQGNLNMTAWVMNINLYPDWKQLEVRVWLLTQQLCKVSVRSCVCVRGGGAETGSWLNLLSDSGEETCWVAAFGVPLWVNSSAQSSAPWANSCCFWRKETPLGVAGVGRRSCLGLLAQVSEFTRRSQEAEKSWEVRVWRRKSGQGQAGVELVEGHSDFPALWGWLWDGTAHESSQVSTYSSQVLSLVLSPCFEIVLKIAAMFLSLFCLMLCFKASTSLLRPFSWEPE